MNIQIHGEHLKLTDALKDYVERKIGRLEKYFDSPPERDVHVKLSVKHGVHRIEVTFSVHGVLFRSEISSKDMYSSIDLVSDKLQHQIQKKKVKLNRHFQDRGLTTRVKHGVTYNSGSSAVVLDEEPTGVRTKRFAIKPMTEDEAILQMELLGHDFFVFTESDSGTIHVLYRRRDGNYGLIEPM